jgi:tRNA threonylcarbamoyladenosine biosynthesis protein TsaB
MPATGAPRLVLALDSAGSACSVAVGLGERVLAEKQIGSLYRQAEILVSLVDQTMGEAGVQPAALEVVVTTVGPGSFTGIRVGLAAARGIALATGAQLIGVSSFDAVEAEVARSGRSKGRALLIALESRRTDLYVQFFDQGGNPLTEPAAVMPCALGEAASAAVGAQRLLIAGDAARRAATALAQRPEVLAVEAAAPSAVGAFRAGLRLLRHGEVVRAARPLYLRPPGVTLADRSQKQSGTGT